MSRKRDALLLAASFFLPLFLLLLLCAVLHLAPFGEHTLVISDAQGQYLSYFALYQECFAGRADWFYSFGKLLGGSLAGLYAYYLASPFNLLLLLFPKEQLALGMHWMLLLKLSACGLTMAFYLRGMRGLTPMSLLFTTAYALCGYNNAYAWCIMWIDAVVLLPLIALGIERLWRDAKPLLYILSLGGAIVCCFYTGYMLCLFSVLYQLFRLVCDTKRLRELPWKKLVRYALASLLAGGVSAAVLLPGFLALSGGVPVTPYQSIARYTYPAALRILDVLLGCAANKDALVLPTLLTVAALFALAIGAAWLLWKKKGRRAGLCALCVCLTLFALWYLLVELPVGAYLGLSEKRVLPKLLLGVVPFWEFYNGSPNLYAGSLTLLLGLSFFFNRAVPRRERAAGLLLLLALFASACFYLPNLIWHGFEENNCFNYRWSFVFPFALLLLASRSFGAKEGLRPTDLLFPGVFAVLVLVSAFFGPLWFQQNWMLLLAAAFVALELALLYFWLRGRSWAARLLCVTGLAALCLTAGLSFRDQAENSVSTRALAETIRREQARIDEARAPDGDFWRIRKEKSVVNYNDPMLFDYAGLVHFSSAEKLSTIRFLSQIGLHVSPEYWANGDDGESRAADALLGVGRWLGAAGPDAYTALSEGVWENPYRLPLAFYADMSAAGELTLDDAACENLDRVYTALCGEATELFVPAETQGLTLTVERGEPIYLQSWSESLTGLRVLRNGEEIAAFAELWYPNAVCLGTFEIGDELALELSGEGEIPKPPQSFLYYEDSKGLTSCVERLTAECPETRIRSASDIEIRTVSETERLLVLTLPADEGWEVRLDGKAIGTETALNILLALRVPAGEHTLTLRYTPVGLKPGLAISALSLAAVGAWLLLAGRKRKE